MQTTISRPNKMGAVVTRRQKLAKQYAIAILREDMGKTWDEVGISMGMCGSWCKVLYDRTIEDETLDKDLFRPLWL
jgi:hypothetical protein